MMDRELLDQTVTIALEKFVKQSQAATLPPLSDSSEMVWGEGHEEDFLIENIRRSWAQHFETEWRPPKAKRIGLLRTILGSIETFRTPGPHSQGYLHFIAGFLTKKMGVSVRRVTANMEPLPEPEEDELLQIGRRWVVEGDQDSKADFCELANDLKQSSQATRVVHACNRLLGEVSDPYSDCVEILTRMSIQASESLTTSMG